MPAHSEIVGADAVHPIAYYQSADPGAVGAGKHWYDTSIADDLKLKVRNTDNSGWVTLHGKLKWMTLNLGNGIAALATGVRGTFVMGGAGTWVSHILVAPWDATPSITLDIWKDTYANFPPTVADTITASAKPTLSAARKTQDVTLTGWTKTFAAGDQFLVNIDSVSGCVGVGLTLFYVRT